MSVDTKCNIQGIGKRGGMGLFCNVSAGLSALFCCLADDRILAHIQPEFGDQAFEIVKMGTGRCVIVVFGNTG